MGMKETKKEETKATTTANPAIEEMAKFMASAGLNIQAWRNRIGKLSVEESGLSDAQASGLLKRLEHAGQCVSSIGKIFDPAKKVESEIERLEKRLAELKAKKSGK